MTEAKPWYQSRTVWFNAVVLVLTIILYVLQGVTEGKLTLPVSTDIVVMVMGIVNLVLRFVTTQKVSR